MAIEKKLKTDDPTRNRGIKTHKGQDHEGYPHAGNQEKLSERSAQERPHREDESK